MTRRVVRTPTPIRDVLRALPDAFEADAARLEPYARPVAFRECARRLRVALERTDGEVLTLEDAANASGYSADHLGRLIKSGQNLNAGRKGAPRIRLADLPRKAGALRPGPDLSILGATKAQIARAVVTSHSTGTDDD